MENSTGRDGRFQLRRPAGRPLTSAAGVPAPPWTVPIHQLAPAVGFEVLREVSQHTHTKLQTVAETVIA
ncbi:hypothetical protein ACFYY9_03585 [Streptomyces nigra]|uniref:hypothetical protein n=1 Tax=Streptomyces nigra TaxID=1827580 RepID=UPI0036BA2551